MSLTQVTAPAIEPVSLLEAKEHLRVDSGTMADAVTTEHSIMSGEHAIVPAFGLVGEPVEVLGSDVLVNLNAGTFGAGTADVKLQHSEDLVTWLDVAGGAFAQVSVANHEQVFEMAYSAGARYLRAVATVAVAPCAFGVYVVKRAPMSLEDDLISGFITTAREYCEGRQNRAYITQVWELRFDDWPEVIQIPLPPTQLVDSLEYYDTAGVPHLVDPADYLVDYTGYKARVVPAYGKRWPTATLQPLAGVLVTFTAGYGDLATDVPQRVRTAIKLLVGHLYEHREATDAREVEEVKFAVNALLGLDPVGIV